MPEKRFGAYFKELRMKTGLTLRCFCLKHGLDPGNISRIERGVARPPQSRENLERYAKLLNVKPDTDEHYLFFDLAAAESGKLPQDILSDRSLAEKMPLFFRTVRGQKLSQDDIDDVVALIESTWRPE